MPNTICNIIIKDAEGDTPACNLDIGYVIDYSKEEPSEIDVDKANIVADINATKEANLQFIKASLKEEWEAQRLTGAEYSAAIIQAAAVAMQGATQEAISIKDLTFKAKEMLIKEKQARIEISLSLLKLREAELKIKESEARVKLYNEQAKGYRDQTKLNSIKLVFSTWSTMYTQNQLDAHPAFVSKANIEETISKWFEHMELSNPNTYKASDRLKDTDTAVPEGSGVPWNSGN